MFLTKKSKISKYQKYQISIKISKYHDIFQNIMIFSILDRQCDCATHDRRGRRRPRRRQSPT